MKRIALIIAGIFALASVSCSKEDDFSRIEDLISINYWEVVGPASLTGGRDIYVSFFYFEDTGFGTIKYVDKDLKSTLRDHTLYVDGEVTSESFRFLIEDGSLSIHKGGKIYSPAETTFKGDRITVASDANAFFKKRPVFKLTSIESIVDTNQE